MPVITSFVVVHHHVHRQLAQHVARLRCRPCFSVSFIEAFSAILGIERTGGCIGINLVTDQKQCGWSPLTVLQ